MSTTWATRLAANDGHRPRLYFTIQGVPQVFQEDETDVPSVLETSTRTRLKIVEKIDISPSKLNISRRRIEGGTVVITLLEDDVGTLAALFAPRKRRKTYLTANETTTDSTLSVKSLTGLIDTVYVNAETITFTGTGAGPTLTGCARGAFGSTAQAHFGSSTVGSGVFTSPPSWKGRRLYLKSYFLNENGTTTAALSRAEGTYSIEAAPKHTGDGKWELRCAELSDEFFKRKIGGGLREIEPADERMTHDGNGSYRLNVGDGEAFDQFVRGTAKTLVLGKTPDGEFICNRLTSRSGTGTIVVDENTELHLPAYPGAFGDGTIDYQVSSVRHIAVLNDKAEQIAMAVLTSRLGTGVNGTFDTLPGFDRTALGGPQWRMGAGIAAADIDSSSFTLTGGSVGAWSFVIDDETTVADFLFEYCLHTGSIAHLTRSGKLATRLLSETGNDSVMTIDDGMIAGDDDPEVSYDEESIYPRVSLLCNYDPLSREFVGQLNNFDSELTARYENSEDVLELSSKSIVVAARPAGKIRTAVGIQVLERSVMSEADVLGSLRRIQVAGGRGDGYVSMSCHLPVMILELGSVVTLTVGVPNLEGSADISEGLFRVISLGPRWDDGEVDVVLQFLERLYVVAPATRIGAAVGALMVLVNGDFENQSATPGNAYAVGQPVQVWDVSAGTSVQRTITAAATVNVTLSSAPGFVVEANVDFIRPDNQSLAIAATGVTGLAGLDYIYQVRDDENDPTIRRVTRWR